MALVHDASSLMEQEAAANRSCSRVEAAPLREGAAGRLRSGKRKWAR